MMRWACCEGLNMRRSVMHVMVTTCSKSQALSGLGEIPVPRESLEVGTKPVPSSYLPLSRSHQSCPSRHWASILHGGLRRVWCSADRSCTVYRSAQGHAGGEAKRCRAVPDWRAPHGRV